MDKRLRKASRVLSVQKQLHKIAEWKSTDLQRHASELRDAQATLIETLNNDEVLHGLFVEARARRLQALASQETNIKAAQDAQSKIVLERAMQVKRTERLVQLLGQEHRRAEEKKDYLMILDGLATKIDASLP